MKDQAETLSRIQDPQARAAAERAVRSEAATKYATRELAVARQMDDLAVQGYGPQRHGSHITEQQLDNRAMHSIDPVTGTNYDAYNKMPDGTPALHTPTKNATMVMTDEAYVEAEKHIRSSQIYKDAIAEAEKIGRDSVALKGVINLEDIFGVDYKQHVFGKTRIGSKTNPIGTVNTDFTDGTMRVVFRKDASGSWNMHTMFPEPK